jgi:hypothetical protein
MPSNNNQPVGSDPSQNLTSQNTFDQQVQTGIPPSHGHAPNRNHTNYSSGFPNGAIQSSFPSQSYGNYSSHNGQHQASGYDSSVTNRVSGFGPSIGPNTPTTYGYAENGQNQYANQQAAQGDSNNSFRQPLHDVRQFQQGHHHPQQVQQFQGQQPHHPQTQTNPRYFQHSEQNYQNFQQTQSQPQNFQQGPPILRNGYGQNARQNCEQQQQVRLWNVDRHPGEPQHLHLGPAVLRYQQGLEQQPYLRNQQQLNGRQLYYSQKELDPRYSQQSQENYQNRQQTQDPPQQSPQGPPVLRNGYGQDDLYRLQPFPAAWRDWSSQEGPQHFRHGNTELQSVQKTQGLHQTPQSSDAISLNRYGQMAPQPLQQLQVHNQQPITPQKVLSPQYRFNDVSMSGSGDALSSTVLQNQNSDQARPPNPAAPPQPRQWPSNDSIPTSVHDGSTSTRDKIETNGPDLPKAIVEDPRPALPSASQSIVREMSWSENLHGVSVGAQCTPSDSVSQTRPFQNKKRKGKNRQSRSNADSDPTPKRHRKKTKQDVKNRQQATRNTSQRRDHSSSYYMAQQSSINMPNLDATSLMNNLQNFDLSDSSDTKKIIGMKYDPESSVESQADPRFVQSKRVPPEDPAWDPYFNIRAFGVHASLGQSTMEKQIKDYQKSKDAKFDDDQFTADIAQYTIEYMRKDMENCNFAIHYCDDACETKRTVQTGINGVWGNDINQAIIDTDRAAPVIIVITPKPDVEVPRSLPALFRPPYISPDDDCASLKVRVMSKDCEGDWVKAKPGSYYDFQIGNFLADTHTGLQNAALLAFDDELCNTNLEKYFQRKGLELKDLKFEVRANDVKYNRTLQTSPEGTPILWLKALLYVHKHTFDESGRRYTSLIVEYSGRHPASPGLKSPRHGSPSEPPLGDRCSSSSSPGPYISPNAKHVISRVHRNRRRLKLDKTKQGAISESEIPELAATPSNRNGLENLDESAVVSLGFPTLEASPYGSNLRVDKNENRSFNSSFFFKTDLNNDISVRELITSWISTHHGAKRSWEWLGGICIPMVAAAAMDYRFYPEEALNRDKTTQETEEHEARIDNLISELREFIGVDRMTNARTNKYKDTWAHYDINWSKAVYSFYNMEDGQFNLEEINADRKLREKGIATRFMKDQYQPSSYQRMFAAIYFILKKTGPRWLHIEGLLDHEMTRTVIYILSLDVISAFQWGSWKLSLKSNATAEEETQPAHLEQDEKKRLSKLKILKQHRHLLKGELGVCPMSQHWGFPIRCICHVLFNSRLAESNTNNDPLHGYNLFAPKAKDFIAWRQKFDIYINPDYQLEMHFMTMGKTSPSSMFDELNDKNILELLPAEDGSRRKGSRSWRYIVLVAQENLSKLWEAHRAAWELKVDQKDKIYPLVWMRIRLACIIDGVSDGESQQSKALSALWTDYASKVFGWKSLPKLDPNDALSCQRLPLYSGTLITTRPQPDLSPEIDSLQAFKGFAQERQWTLASQHKLNTSCLTPNEYQKIKDMLDLENMEYASKAAVSNPQMPTEPQIFEARKLKIAYRNLLSEIGMGNAITFQKVLTDTGLALPVRSVQKRN